ncbi:hypothetical protein FRC09_003032 [Ceratobasidium sp. 395]|nr:hypothetical protein FRC09_003032 [Ceratobasidium sp. 395]
MSLGTVPVERNLEEIAKIQEAADQVLKHVWHPGFMMIDKDRAERKASVRVFPKTPVQVCQFHAVQAILRWLHASHTYVPETDSAKSSKSKKIFIVPEEVHLSRPVLGLCTKGRKWRIKALNSLT